MSESQVPSAVSADLSLRHVMLVGGTLAEWAALSDDAWSACADEMGSYLGSIGVPWLTVRPYEVGDEVAGSGGDIDSQADQRGMGKRPTLTFASGCTVIVDPSADGRQRFADAMESLPVDDEVNEATVSAVLYEPADSEPDLVIVLGRSDQLPPSLVWEIAYAELYFADIEWAQLGADVLERAVGGFADRRRRFGGLPGVIDESDSDDYASDDYESDDFETDEYDSDEYQSEGDAESRSDS